MKDNEAIIIAAKSIIEQNQKDLIEIYKELSKSIIELKLWEMQIMHQLGATKENLLKIQKHIDKEIAKGFKQLDSKND